MAIMATPRSEPAHLTTAEEELIDAYWRAANYLCEY